jgi:aminomethyltransferase
MDTLRRTPLFERHQALGARMVDFGGWEMPVQYSGIVEEHKAVRTNVGLFDVSHMGEFSIRGPRLIPFLDYLCANDATRLEVGRAQYSMLLNPQGGTIDDIIVYRLSEDEALMVVNSSNIEKDWAHVSSVAADWDGVTVENLSNQYGLLAVQGPKAEALVNELADVDVSTLPYYGVTRAKIGPHDVIVARTGYTGEDGFEIFIQWDDAPDLWDRLMDAGAAHGLRPAGLGARDTLRLEASMPLYGHELNEEISPIEAGLGFFVAKEGDYIGAARQRELRQRGPDRKLVMLRLLDRGIAREGYEVVTEHGTPIGQVTSGSQAPYLGYAIAQALVDAAHAQVGDTVYISLRGRRIPAEIVKRPFYKRPN